MIVGIDPGPTNSGVVFISPVSFKVEHAFPAMDNRELIGMLRTDIAATEIALECIEAMYAHVGKETVRTIRFCGAIEEACLSRDRVITCLSPQDVKKAVCGTASAKDPAVRQAIIDRLGAPGTKKNPGPTFGVSSHAWRALAVALAATLTRPNQEI